MTEPTELMRTFPAAPDKQVTIANMQEGPWNRWAFRNLRRLLPTGNVWRGTGPVAPLDVRPYATSTTSSSTIARVRWSAWGNGSTRATPTVSSCCTTARSSRSATATGSRRTSRTC